MVPSSAEAVKTVECEGTREEINRYRGYGGHPWFKRCVGE